MVRTPAAARFLTLSPRYLEKLRVIGGGPVYVRLGRRAVAYRLADLEAWAAARQRTSTSDPGPQEG